MSLIGEIAERLLAETKACLVAAGIPVERAVVSTGTVTWDECCKGFLYVNVIRTFRSETFPVEDLTWVPCRRNPLAVELAVGVIRCSPMPDDRGNLPTPEAITESSLAVLTDAEVVYRCLNGFGCDDEPDDRASVLLGQTMLADAGGCVGHETRLLVEL